MEGDEDLENVYPGTYSKIDIPGEYFNDGVTRKLDNIIVVGSIDQTGEVADFSQNKPVVDIYTPGVGIRTTNNVGGYESSGEGNSFAAPFVSGAAAAIWNYVSGTDPAAPRWKKVKDLLVTDSKRLDFGNVVKSLIESQPPDDGDDDDDDESTPPPSIIFKSGGFESYDSHRGFDGWDVEAGSAPSSGTVGNPTVISPHTGAGMAYLTTLGSGIIQTRFSQDFTVPAGVKKIKVEFAYAVISEEFHRTGDRFTYDKYKIFLKKEGGNDTDITPFVTGNTNEMFPVGVDRSSVKIDGISLSWNGEVGSKSVEIVDDRNTVDFEVKEFEQVVEENTPYRFVILIEDWTDRPGVDTAYESRLYIDDVIITPIVEQE